MTVDQLKVNMRSMLEHFKKRGQVISDATIHNTVLSDSDGFGQVNSKRVYKDSIRYSIIMEMGKSADKPWPKKWLDKSVQELAEVLLS
jgi:hypothetical protein